MLLLGVALLCRTLATAPLLSATHLHYQILRIHLGKKLDRYRNTADTFHRELCLRVTHINFPAVNQTQGDAKLTVVHAGYTFISRSLSEIFIFIVCFRYGSFDICGAAKVPYRG